MPPQGLSLGRLWHTGEHVPSRRSFCLSALYLGAAALCSRRAASGEAADAGELAPIELELPEASPWRGKKQPMARALVLVPAHGPRTGPQPSSYPALMLLHGRGEVGDDALGINAWRTRYGLADSYARLRRAPVRLEGDASRYMRPEQLETLNAELATEPFQGLVLICPVTPNPSASRAPDRTLDAYADWLVDVLLPAVCDAAPLGAAPRIGIDGCSMGGYVAAEVFARKPQAFHTFGVVQPAFGSFRVPRYARQLAPATQRADFGGVHLLTSTHDPYREATEALGRELERLGARPTLKVLPGPHDQRWLRAAGTLTLLGWHDRHLRQPPARRVL